MHNICLFGDSTAWGAWDKEKGGWANRLWLDLAGRAAENYLYNLSISGATTETILARFEAEVKIREADILIFQTGGNDAAYENREGNYLVAPGKFEVNLQEIIKRAKKITSHIIFIGSKNCNETKTKPVSWANTFYTNHEIQKYNEIMQKVCEKNDVIYLNVFGLLNNDDFEDGLHPNAQGHEKMYRLVKKVLDKEIY